MQEGSETAGLAVFADAVTVQARTLLHKFGRINASVFYSETYLQIASRSSLDIAFVCMLMVLTESNWHTVNNKTTRNFF